MFQTCKLLLLLVVVAIVATPDAARAAVDPEVERLFKQLSADDFKAREEARKQLTERGEEAVPQIKALAEKAEDPETKAAVAAILDAIDARSITGPSLITLDVKDAPVKDVIAAIAKQARTELRAWPDDMWNQLDKKTITLKMTRQPFWAVMKEVLPQAGLHLNAHGPGNRIQLMRGTSEMSGPSHLSGPFMVVATSASESRTIRYDRPEQGQNGGTHINVNVYVEPKLRLLSRDYQPQIEEFVDDAGHSLVVPGARFGRQMSQSRESIFNVNVQVPAVDGRTKRVAKLKGSIRAVIQTRSETIEVKDILNAKGSSHVKGEWTLFVDDVSAADGNAGTGTYVLNLRFVKNDPAAAARGPGDPDWRRNLSFDSVTLVDADGRELSKQGHGMSGDGKKWEGNFRFTRAGQARTGEPAKLVWEFPLEGEEVQIPFEFKDLPLP